MSRRHSKLDAVRDGLKLIATAVNLVPRLCLGSAWERGEG
jgi:hypothetical protein